MTKPVRTCGACKYYLYYRLQHPCIICKERLEWVEKGYLKDLHIYNHYGRD